MRVKVLNEDGTSYSSLVYGIHSDDWKTEVFVMTPDYQLQRVFEYSQENKQIKKLVFVTDPKYANCGWIEDGDYEGYSWFIHKTHIMDQIRNNEPVDEDFRRECEEMYASYIGGYESQVVDDADTCENLLWFAGSFHDAVVVGFDWSEDKTKLTVTLEGVWGFEKFYLDFEGNITAVLENDYDTFYFSGASLFIDDNQVCFVDEEGYEKKSDVNEYYTHVYADKLSYRYVFAKPVDKE